MAKMMALGLYPKEIGYHEPVDFQLDLLGKMNEQKWFFEPTTHQAS